MPVVAVVLLVGAGLLLRSPSSEGEDPPVDLASFVARGLVRSQAAFTFGDDESLDAWARAYHDGAVSGSFEIVRGERRLAAGRDYRFVVLDRIPRSSKVVEFFPESLEGDADGASRSAETPEETTDVTGDGVPEAIVEGWTGGVHCCFTLHVFQFEPTFRAQAIDLGHSDLGVFAQADADPALEILLPDWTFAYWECGFAYSPVPLVVLDFDGESWRPSAALMRRPPGEMPDAAAFAARWRRWQAGEPEPSGEHLPAPWGELLELLYSGNAALAWRLLDAGWPGDDAGKAEFRASLLERLRHSEAWPVIVELNGSALWGAGR